MEQTYLAKLKWCWICEIYHAWHWSAVQSQPVPTGASIPALWQYR